MKSCLRSPSVPGSPNPAAYCPKHVAWGGDGTNEIHFADEWDRTPSEPARKLSYQELLELEEITQSLPNARQPFDLRPPKQALSRVPIGLLPLVSADAPTSPPTTSPVSPQTSTSTFVMPPGRARPAPAPRLASPSLTHLRPLAPPEPKPRPIFSFVPLLAPESPTPPTRSQPHFPPYSPERAAADGEPDRVLPPPRSKAVPIPSSHSAHAHAFGGFGYEAQYRAAEAAAYSPPFGSSAYDYKRDKHRMLADDKQSSAVASSSKSKPKRRKKKMSIMVINDMEIEMEEEGSETDESESEPVGKLPVPPPPPIARSPTDKLSLRLASRPDLLSPPCPGIINKPLVSAARPQSPTSGRLSPVQARASSRLLRN